MAEQTKLPPGFIYMSANHSFRLTGEGRVLLFEKDKIVPVPRGLQSQALAYGAFALEGEAQPQENPVAEVQKDPSSDEYRAAVRVAAEKLLAKNSPDDFGANGKPYVKAWERELKWRPIESVRDEIWELVKDENRA